MVESTSSPSHKENDSSPSEEIKASLRELGFNPDLDRKEAFELLKYKPVNSFLLRIRKAENPGALVLSCVTCKQNKETNNFEKKVIHTLIEFDTKKKQFISPNKSLLREQNYSTVKEICEELNMSKFIPIKTIANESMSIDNSERQPTVDERKSTTPPSSLSFWQNSSSNADIENPREQQNNSTPEISNPKMRCYTIL